MRKLDNSIKIDRLRRLKIPRTESSTGTLLPMGEIETKKVRILAMERIGEEQAGVVEDQTQFLARKI
jgi:hypothetical protein